MEIKITQEQKNKVDRYIELVEQLAEVKKEYPAVYTLLYNQLMPMSSWDDERRTVLPREVLKYKAVAEIFVQDEEFKVKAKKVIELKKKLKK